MNIQHMKYAVEVERTGSISQAADNLFMGQPNLSKSIKELELSLGIRIFKRTTRGVTPTAKGREFLDSAKTILEHIEEMEARYQQGGQRAQSFAISVPRCSYIVSAFTAFVSGLEEMEAEPELEIKFSETGSVQAINNVVEEGYRLGIIRYNTGCEPYFLQLLSDQNLSHRSIWEFDGMVLMAASHPLAMREAVTSADLAPYVEVFQGGCPAENRFYRKAGKLGGPQSHKNQVCVQGRGSQLDMLARIPGAYLWESPVPEDILARNGLVLKRCTDRPYRLKDVLVYPRSYKFTPVEQFFLEKLEEEKRLISRIESRVG